MIYFVLLALVIYFFVPYIVIIAALWAFSGHLLTLIFWLAVSLFLFGHYLLFQRFLSLFLLYKGGLQPLAAVRKCVFNNFQRSFQIFISNCQKAPIVLLHDAFSKEGGIFLFSEKLMLERNQAEDIASALLGLYSPLALRVRKLLIPAGAVYLTFCFMITAWLPIRLQSKIRSFLISPYQFMVIILQEHFPLLRFDRDKILANNELGQFLLELDSKKYLWNGDDFYNLMVSGFALITQHHGGLFRESIFKKGLKWD